MFSDGDDSGFREAMDAVSLTHLLASKLGANPLTRDAAERISHQAVHLCSVAYIRSAKHTLS